MAPPTKPEQKQKRQRQPFPPRAEAAAAALSDLPEPDGWLQMPLARSSPLPLMPLIMMPFQLRQKRQAIQHGLSSGWQQMQPCSRRQPSRWQHLQHSGGQQMQPCMMKHPPQQTPTLGPG